MKRIKLLFAFLPIVLTFISCNPNDGTSGLGHDADNLFAHDNFGTEVPRDFIGQIVDANNQPIQGVTVSIGIASVQTDVNGVFIINSAAVHQKFAYITATKTGYIDGSRSMVPTAGKNKVKIMLLPSSPTQTIQSGAASEVALPNGTKVAFDGAFKDENEAAYTGDVSVTLFHLLPSDTTIDQLMPGMLYGQTATNTAAVLATFGMMNVELRGSAGQKLNLADGHTAEITMKIDDSQAATAPASIPLWHFDAAKGYWKEEGVATKVGNNYVGEVSHFSWWNCDMPNSSIVLTFTVVDSNNNPLSNIYVQLLNAAGYHAVGSTDSNGMLSGILPANQVLTLNVYGTNNCGIAYTSTIGPFTTDTIVPTVVLGTTAVSSSIVTGTLLKCDNTNVTNGYVLIHYGNQENSVAVTNGIFSFNMMYCNSNNSFTLQGVDFDTVQTTDNINYTFTQTTTNIGVLTACSATTEFISYKIDNQPEVIIFSANAQIIPFNDISISATSANGPIIIYGLNTATPGTYTTSNFTIDGSEFNMGTWLNNSLIFTVSNVGAIGSYIDMTFDGPYQDANGTHTVTGTVHVIRDN